MYNEFYGFREAPFNITPDPRFLFFSDKHREAFNHVLFGIRERKGFIQITGEVGAGKTTVCRAILTELGPAYKTALILNPMVTATQLMRTVLAELGLEPRKLDRTAYLEILNRYLLDQAAAGHDVVLLIDEAQDLDPELLEQVRLLSNLETDQRKLLQIVLIGQPELRDKLNEKGLRQLRQRITVRYHLASLDRFETERYIAHRLRVAGADGRPSFSRWAIRKVHGYSQRGAAADQCRLRQGASLRLRQRNVRPEIPRDRPGDPRARGRSRLSLIDDALKRAQAADDAAAGKAANRPWIPDADAGRGARPAAGHAARAGHRRGRSGRRGGHRRRSARRRICAPARPGAETNKAADAPRPLPLPATSPTPLQVVVAVSTPTTPVPALMPNPRPRPTLAAPAPLPSARRRTPRRLLPLRPSKPSGAIANGRTYAGSVPLPNGEKIELGGIVWSETEPRALLNDRVLGTDSYVEGFRVAKIEEDRVALEKDGVTIYVSVK